MPKMRLTAVILVLAASASFSPKADAAALFNITGGGSFGAGQFAGYGTDGNNNNVINPAPTNPGTGSIIYDPSATGANYFTGAASALGVVATGNYQIDWFFIGFEAWNNATFAIGAFSQTTSGHELNSNTNANLGAQPGPSFMTTTFGSGNKTAIDFTLGKSGGTLGVDLIRNGQNNNTNTPGLASLIFAYLTPAGIGPDQNGENYYFRVSDRNTPTEWILFALNDNGSSDDNHDDFIGIARVYGFSDDDGFDIPLPGSLPLFTTALGALGFIAYRRKRKQAT